MIAIVVGTLLAILALVPWTAWEYRRHGQLGFRRSLMAFGVLAYCLALVTYTLLPLPSDVLTMCGNPVSPQLSLFAFLEDIAKQGGITGPRSLLANPASAQVLFNVLFFVPLGALTRHAVARKRVVAGLLIGLAIGFVVSLIIETTQLTGDWFLYPCAYRLFDVDDLLANTTGAAIGTFLAPFVGLLAGSDRTNHPATPRPITATRRFSGVLVDVLAIWLLSTTLSVTAALAWAATGKSDQDPTLGILITTSAFVAPAAQLTFILKTGRTFGEHVVLLRPAPAPGTGKRLLRWALGSGGWSALLAIDLPLSGFLAFVLAVASTVAIWATRQHRGLALAIIRTSIEDDRTPSGSPHTDLTAPG